MNTTRMLMVLTLIGFVTSKSYANGYDRHEIYYPQRSCAPPVQVWSCPPPVPRCAQPVPVVVRTRPSIGYWQWNESRCWVPGRWVAYHSHYTGAQRAWQGGHYETSRTRVWVSAPPRSRMW